MVEQTGIGNKIGGGFGLVLILTALVGGIADWSMLTVGAIAAGEVSKAVAAVSSITDSSSNCAAEMASSAQELAERAQRMQDLVERFKVSGSSSLLLSATGAASS